MNQGYSNHLSTIAYLPIRIPTRASLHTAAHGGMVNPVASLRRAKKTLASNPIGLAGPASYPTGLAGPASNPGCAQSRVGGGKRRKTASSDLKNLDTSTWFK